MLSELGLKSPRDARPGVSRGGVFKKMTVFIQSESGMCNRHWPQIFFEQSWWMVSFDDEW